MAYGMTYGQYWFGNPMMVRAYAQKYLLQRKIDNEMAWIYGAYVYNAVGATLATAFGHTRKEYVRKPIDFFPKTESELEEEKRHKRRKLIEFLNRFAKRNKKD